MRKWIGVIVAILWVLCLSVLPVSANTQVVTVYATPLISSGIIGFTITYVSDTRLDLNWGFSGNATGIMIRAKYGQYPTDIPNELTTPTDGYLVYSGNGTSISDTSMDFNQNLGILYYAAWAQKADGTWFTSPSKGWKESREMLLIAFIFLSLALMAIAYWVKRPAIGVAAGVSWLLLGLYNLSVSVTTWDIYYDLFVMGIAMFIASLIEAQMLRPKVAEENEEEDVWGKARSEYIERKKQQNERLQDLRVIMGRRVNKRRENNNDDYEFENTGRFN